MTLAERYDSFLFDLDGTLYRGEMAITGAAEVMSRLREMGKGISFVTNNSSRTPEQIAEFMSDLGMKCDPSEVETSGLATAEVLAARGVSSAFVVGEIGLEKALSDRGIALVDSQVGEVDVVVVGWDRRADYAKLRDACLFLERGAELIGSNSDAAYPAPDGKWPGAGALLAAIQTTTGATAEIIGKPHPPLFLGALKKAGGENPLVVGDRLDSDISGAAGLGWDSLLVLTGVSTMADALAADPAATFISDDVKGLFDPAITDGPSRSETGPSGK